MKNKHLVLAIVTMAVAAILSIAVVSCKKDTTNEMVSGTSESPAAFDPSHITDMNAYLKDFKQRMKTSKDGETLTLEEAAWHLSSVANYDFANANVEFTDLRYDTLYYQVNVTNGRVALSDLNTVYQSMAGDIDAFYQSLDLQGKHFRFIGVSVSEDGQVEASLTTSYNDEYHLWYPQDTIFCDLYFDEYSIYPANGSGLTELISVLNLIESHPTTPIQGRIYYTITREEKPLFWDYIDPYGAPNFANSRIYCTKGYFGEDISAYMCYYLCSYHALGHELLHTGLQYNEVIINWSGIWRIFDYANSSNPTEGNLEQQTAYHELTIKYGFANYPSGEGFEY